MNLTALNLSGCDDISDEAVRCVVDRLPLLTSLDLGDCARLTDKAAKQVMRLQKLRHLRVGEWFGQESYSASLDPGQIMDRVEWLELGGGFDSRILNLTEFAIQRSAFYCDNEYACD